MQVGRIQIILSDHVSLKIRNTYIKLEPFSSLILGEFLEHFNSHNLY